jgi:hypothetical protein
MSQFVMFEGHPMTPAARDAILIRRGEQPGAPIEKPHAVSKAQPGDFVRKEKARAAGKAIAKKALATVQLVTSEIDAAAQAAADLGESLDPLAEQAAADREERNRRISEDLIADAEEEKQAAYESARADEADLGGEG